MIAGGPRRGAGGGGGGGDPGPVDRPVGGRGHPGPGLGLGHEAAPTLCDLIVRIRI